MVRAFFWSKKWFLWAYGGGIILLISLYIQVSLSVEINEWYKSFYNLLQTALNYVVNGTSDLGKEKMLSEFLIFFKIAIPYVLIASGTNYFTKRYSLWWREAMTFDYIPRWRNVKEEIEGASQRIQEDAFRFARSIETLGLQIVRAVMTLIAFLPLLWLYSGLLNIPTFKLFGRTWLQGEPFRVINALEPDDIDILQKVVENFDQLSVNFIPGSLVWAALIACLGGLIISWFVGWYLPQLEYNNQKVEAAFRKELVLGEDDKINYCSMETLTKLFLGKDAITDNYKRLFLHYGYFDLWIILYDQFMSVFPYIVVAPGLFSGLLTLGVMMQVSNAFQRVHGSFAIFIHSWTTITELRSIWKRLHEFEGNLDKHQIVEDNKNNNE